MKYRLICFDYDYTLGNTEGGIAESIEYALREMNLSVPSRERIYSTIGLTLSKTYLSLTGDDSTENAARFSSLFAEKPIRLWHVPRCGCPQRRKPSES